MDDWSIDDDGPAVKPAHASTREDVPAGTHDFKIRQVIPSDDGLEIRLEHPERRYGWVFCRLRKSQGWSRPILASLRTALGMTAEQWAASDPGDLASLNVRARIYHQDRRDGGVWVNVGEFLPPAEPDPAVATPEEQAAHAPPKVTRRTATQKADAAAAMPDDDIPF
jgi:hypothetical protein